MIRPFTYCVAFNINADYAKKVERIMKLTGYNKPDITNADFYRDVIFEPRIKELEELYKIGKD